MRVVIALGGNALLRRGQALTAENQRENVQTAAVAMAPIAKGRWASCDQRFPSRTLRAMRRVPEGEIRVVPEIAMIPPIATLNTSDDTDAPVELVTWLMA